MAKYQPPPPPPENGFALSVGDLMAALMLVFVLLLAATLLQLQEEFESRASVAERYVKVKEDLVAALKDEFSDDLVRWNAEIDEDKLLIRFNSVGGAAAGGPRFYWARAGDYQLTPDHREILDDFFPRYARVLERPQFRDNVQEIRIEGHTDASWYSDEDAYIGNMALSQNRTRSVLAYALNTVARASTDDGASAGDDWLTSRITANGLSSSRLLVPDEPNAARNRRVEFRVVTNAEEELTSLLE